MGGASALRASARRGALLLAAGLAGLAFVLAAAVRRLNFDESLALRSGWLLVEGTPSEPPFYMPFILALGLGAHALDDPGLLFAAGRLAASLAVLGGLAWMLARARLGPETAVAAGLLCLLQAAFAVHAYELRYDWALLLGWMAAFGLLQRRTPAAFAGLGLCVAWLAAHHLKGVYFAGCAYLFAVAAALAAGPGRRERLVWLHGAALAGAGGWLGLSAALERTPALLGVYASFAGVAADQPKVWPWRALAPSLARDAVWWGGAALAVAATGLRVLRRPPRDLADACARPELWALAFAAVPLAFLFLHPHPWPYMLALPAPFLALLGALAARRLAATVRGPGRGLLAAGAAAGAVAAYGLASGVWPGGPYAAALGASSAPQVETLRLLRQLAEPGERVVDPSGLAYFQPPCTPQWYVDTLFAPRAARGDWMAGLADRPAAECPWVVNTYRLGMLAESQRDRIRRDYVLVTGGLAVARGDPRLARPERWPRLGHEQLRSFWW